MFRSAFPTLDLTPPAKLLCSPTASTLISGAIGFDGDNDFLLRAVDPWAHVNPSREHNCE